MCHTYLGGVGSSLVRVRLGRGFLVDVRWLRRYEHPDLSPPADEEYDGAHPQDLVGNSFNTIEDFNLLQKMYFIYGSQFRPNNISICHYRR